MEFKSPGDRPRLMRRKYRHYACYGVAWYWLIRVDEGKVFVEENENRQGQFVMRQVVRAGDWFAPELFSRLEVNLAVLTRWDFKRAVRGKAKPRCKAQCWAESYNFQVPASAGHSSVCGFGVRSMHGESPYHLVIGLEVHVQLLTKTKLFCGCSTEFGLPPNSATCPVCIGMPGVLPVMNRQALELALKAALALNADIAPFTKWDRKNYYYPDLPKNYQISQYDLPFSRNGWLEIQTSNGRKKVRLIRVHLEEDAGKMLHDETGMGRDSLVDLNRAGTPLLEIVTHPDMNSPEEARLFLEELRLLLRELKVSDCEMQEGSLRVDANVNIHVPQGDGYVATPIVEVKNLNSFRSVERAMAYEGQRQYEEFLRTGKKLGEVPKATAGWDEDRGITVVQRRKEEASDYRYFPEPDLVPVVVDQAWLARLRAELPELPAARRERFQRQYQLSAYDASVIVSQGLAFADYFEKVAQLTGDAKAAANWCTNQVLQVLGARKISIQDFPLAPERLAELISKQREYRVNPQRAREVFNEMLETGGSAEAIIKRLGLDVPFSTEQLRELVKKSIASQPKAVADVRAGKTKAMDALVGMVMRETRGKAPPDEVRRLIQEELAAT